MYEGQLSPTEERVRNQDAAKGQANSRPEAEQKQHRQVHPRATRQAQCLPLQCSNKVSLSGARQYAPQA